MTAASFRGACIPLVTCMVTCMVGLTADGADALAHKALRYSEGSNSSGATVAVTDAELSDDELAAYDACFGPQRAAFVCGRFGTLTILAILTALVCLGKALQFHCNGGKRAWLRHQVVIFYLAFVQSLLCFFHWVKWPYSALIFAAQYVQLIQFLVVSWFCGTMACRIVGRHELVKRIVHPPLIFFFLYFTCVFVFGLIYVKEAAKECLEPHWLLFSVSNAILAQLCVVAGYLIIRKLNATAVSLNYKLTTIRGLIGLMVVYEISAAVAIIYDILLITIGREYGCDGIFGGKNSVGTTLAYVILKFCKILLPSWTFLFIFKAAKAPPADVPAVDSSVHSSTFESRHDSHGSKSQHSMFGETAALGANDEEGASPRIYGSLDSLSTPLMNGYDAAYARLSPGDINSASQSTPAYEHYSEDD